jgi:hypothetical protein
VGVWACVRVLIMWARVGSCVRACARLMTNTKDAREGFVQVLLRLLHQGRVLSPSGSTDSQHSAASQVIKVAAGEERNLVAGLCVGLR